MNGINVERPVFQNGNGRTFKLRRAIHLNVYKVENKNHEHQKFEGKFISKKKIRVYTIAKGDTSNELEHRTRFGRVFVDKLINIRTLQNFEFRIATV